MPDVYVVGNQPNIVLGTKLRNAIIDPFAPVKLSTKQYVGRTDAAIATYTSSITGTQSGSSDEGGVPASGGAATGADAQSWSDSV
jgi:hypothetical protein